jgi:hypothetical protein
MSKIKDKVEDNNPTYKYLIASALAEEMHAFYETNKAFTDRIRLEGEVEATKLKFEQSEQIILTLHAPEWECHITLQQLCI